MKGTSVTAWGMGIKGYHLLGLLEAQVDYSKPLPPRG